MPHATKLERFVSQLTALSKKHSFIIVGCGCCNSPRLIPLDGDTRGKYVYRADAPDGTSALDWEGTQP